MEESFILSNKFRRAVFNGIVAGESDITMIAKKHHMLLSIAKKAAGELVDEGIIKEERGRYFLTREGDKIAERMKSQEL